MSSDEDDATALREIKWSTIVLGQRQPSELAPEQEFTTKSGDKYPIDIVLALEDICNVYKVIVDVDDFHTPSRVDVSVGLGAAGEEKNYRNARQARFKTGVVLEYKKRDRSASRLEMKQAFTDAVGQYVWLVVNEPTKHRTNPDEIVTIRKITVLGYPLTDKEKSKIKKKNLGIVDERERIRPPSGQKSEDDNKKPGSSSSQRSGSSSGQKPGSSSSQRPGSSSSQKPGSSSSQRASSSQRKRNPGGTQQSNAAMGGDALSSLRLVRNAIEEKMERADQSGKGVEAAMCKRAVQQLNEYEGKIQDLAVRRSNALTLGDSELAQRHQLAMLDCRDTAMRTAHVDLLLGRDELKSIGGKSEWEEND